VRSVEQCRRSAAEVQPVARGRKMLKMGVEARYCTRLAWVMRSLLYVLNTDDALQQYDSAHSGYGKLVARKFRAGFAGVLLLMIASASLAHTAAGSSTVFR
jgi:hypothetical protein